MKELEKLDYEHEVADVLAEVWDKDMLTLTVAEVADPGEEVEVGTESRVDIEALGYLERIILPDNNLLPVHFLEEGATKQRAVARVAKKSPAGAGWGTGWLVGRDILITNNHVIGTKQKAKELRAEFNYQFAVDGTAEAADIYDFDPDGFFYTNPSLDFTLVKIKCKSLFLKLPLRVQRIETDEYLVLDEYTPDPFGPDLDQPRIGDASIALTQPSISRLPYKLCIAPGTRWGKLQLPTSGIAYAVDEHINVVQHPAGRRKEVAVQQNRLTNIYANHVRYTTDTEPGSSGSPVFNNGWDLLAIHHAGGEYSDGKWKNNQGVRIDRIVADIQANHGTGSWVRNQLAI